MPYTRLGPFVDGGAPYLSAATFNHLEDGIAAGGAGPARIAADQAGVTATGTDVSAAFTALLAGISSYTAVILPTGTINLGTANYTIDVAKIALVADRTVLTGAGTITLTSTVGYSTRQKNWGAALRGVALQGVNLTIGSATASTVGMFRLTDGGMIGGTLTFASNAWKVAFENFHTQGTTITLPSSATNAGENMTWRDSMLTDSSSLTLGTGDWHFDGCSFDNMTITLTANAVVHMDGPHFEANGGASARLLALSGNASCIITGGILVIDPGTGNWTEAPFYVDPAVVHGGLTVRGMQVPIQAYYVPETSDSIRVLVAGGGPATLSDLTTFDAGATPYALAESSNAVRNGGCEENAVTGWTTAGTGTWTADTAVKNRGTYSHKLSAATGQTVTFYQDFPAQPGRLLWLQGWQKFTATTSATFSTQLYFYDRAGNQITTTDYVQWTSTATGIYAVARRIPAGTAYARIFYYLVGGTSGTAVANVDDVIANIA